MKNRRTYTAEFKVQVVIELLTGEKGLMQASREYGIKDTVLSRWKQEFLERAPQVFGSPSQTDDQGEKIAELERMVGRLTVQLEAAKKVLGYSPASKENG
jgi:transposase